MIVQNLKGLIPLLKKVYQEQWLLSILLVPVCISKLPHLLPKCEQVSVLKYLI